VELLLHSLLKAMVMSRDSVICGRIVGQDGWEWQGARDGGSGVARG
jgi:hypothetical protein